MTDCLCIPIGWPLTPAKANEPSFHFLYKIGIIRDLHLIAGHAAMLLIRKDNGRVEYYDFGRYSSPPKMGRVRSSESDPHLKIYTKATFEDGKIQNLQAIIDEVFALSEFIQSVGDMYFGVYEKVDYDKAITLIDNLIERGFIRYTSFLSNSTNCARFVNAVMQTSTNSTIDKLKLQFPFSYKASPLGNITATATQQRAYVKSAGQPIKVIKLNWWRNMKILYKNFRKCFFTGEKKPHFSELIVPDRHENVPESAQWITGLGFGVWVVLTPLLGDEFRVQAYFKTGKVNYDTVMKLEDRNTFNSNEAYRLVHECTRRKTTVLQNDHKIELLLVRDFVDHHEAYLV